MQNYFLSGVFFFIFFTACTHQPEVSSPEMVVQQWQSYIDHNQFDRARTLSMGQATTYVDYMTTIITKETADTSLTEILQLKCAVSGDTAVCRYMIEDETGEKMPGEIKLRRVKGQWLVNRVEDFVVPAADTLRPEEIERVFPQDSLDEEFQ